VNGLEVGELVIVRVDAGAEEKTGVAAVDDLVVAELDKVGLVFLIAGCDEAVDFAFELDLLLVAKRGVPFRETSLAPEK
jgi:phosphopantetheine adenylyltransferase